MLDPKCKTNSKLLYFNLLNQNFIECVFFLRFKMQRVCPYLRTHFLLGFNSKLISITQCLLFKKHIIVIPGQNKEFWKQVFFIFWRFITKQLIHSVNHFSELFGFLPFLVFLDPILFLNTLNNQVSVYLFLFQEFSNLDHENFILCIHQGH